MQCHYEVLGLTKEATDDEIKKSYRGLALLWHPDKNPEKIEECTKKFLIIQQAYKVLSDPQERAWYDKHRDAILRGGLGNGENYQDNSCDVYRYFNVSCFSGYGDDDEGFYAVYGQVFKTISAEDGEYLDLANGDALAPEFGNSQSSYEEVVGPFYAYWESYCTAKSYVWVEKYDTREAPNRQVRRLMEQENKKLRDKARKERNEEVQALVAFVRKRDKRVQAYKKKLEERATEIAQLAEQRKQRDRQERLKLLENYKESQWSSMSALEKELQTIEANYAKEFGEEHSDGLEEEDEEEEEEAAELVDVTEQKEEAVNGNATAETMENIDDVELLMDDSLFCIACNKDFKSHKSLENHKRSKKHIENMAHLREEMMADDKILAEDDSHESQQKTEEEERNDDDDDDEPELVKKSMSKKQKKKRKQMLQKLQQNQTEEDDDVDDITDNSFKKSVRFVEETEKPDTTKEPEVASDQTDCSERQPDDDDSHIETQPTNINESSKSKPLKKSNKKETKSKANGKEQVSLECHKCNATFASRNKLFEHIAQTGHALHLEEHDAGCSASGPATSNKKSKSKQKRRQ